MNRFWQSFFYGLIVTISIMGPTFGLGVLWTIGTGGDAAAYAVDCIKLSFVCMIFSTWGLYELAGALARANRPRSEDRDQDANQRPEQRDGTNSNANTPDRKDGAGKDQK